jgi:hypothetical protein
MTLGEAKERVSVPALWERYGFSGNPSKSCKSPFREDTNPSFSVFDSGRRWKDHGTGDGGDSITFIEKAEGVLNSQACRKIIAIAGGDTSGLTARKPTKKKPKRNTLNLSGLSESSESHSPLATLRNVSTNAIELCVERGLLRFGIWKSQDSWFVTDGAETNAQARRLDGEHWDEIGAKAWTLPGSEASLPIGLKESSPFRIVLLVEGGPDLLAAAHFIWCENREHDAAPVAMLGAAHKLQGHALSFLAGKRIRIFSHDDQSGINATRRWTTQLNRVDAKVDAVSFQGLKQTNGTPVKDLNDLCYVHADDFEKHQTIQNLIP